MKKLQLKNSQRFLQRKRKKNKPLEPEFFPYTKPQIAILKNSVRNLLKPATRENPLVLSEICQKLLGSQGVENQTVISRLLEEVRQEFLTSGYLIGCKPLPDLSEMAFYVQSRRASLIVPSRKPYKRAVSEARISRKPDVTDEVATTEIEPNTLNSAEIQLLVYRLSVVKDQFRQMGLNIKIDNPVINRLIQGVGSLASLSPRELEENLFSAIEKFRKNIDLPGGDELSQEPSPELRWLILTCKAASAFYQKKTGHDFFELLCFSHEEWSTFLGYIYSDDTLSSQSLTEVSKSNGRKLILDIMGEASIKAGVSQSLVERVGAIPASPTHGEVRQTLAQRREEKLKKIDPELDSHIEKLLEQLGIKNPDKKTHFFVPQLDRIFGIYDSKLKDWEENKKYIKRSGGKSKKDKRHPSFDVVESVLIGYLADNYIQMSREISSDLRRYVRKYLNERSLVSTQTR